MPDRTTIEDDRATNAAVEPVVVPWLADARSAFERSVREDAERVRALRNALVFDVEETARLDAAGVLTVTPEPVVVPWLADARSAFQRRIREAAARERALRNGVNFDEGEAARLDAAGVLTVTPEPVEEEEDAPSPCEGLTVGQARERAERLVGMALSPPQESEEDEEEEPTVLIATASQIQQGGRSTRLRCGSCDEIARARDFCTTCEYCHNCCECWVCPSCDGRQLGEDAEYCSECERCNACCSCQSCGHCGSDLGESGICDHCGRCSGCCRCDPSGLLRGYDTDVLGSLPFFPDRTRKIRYYGMEVEVRSRGDRADALTTLQPFLREWAIFKRDGSLDDQAGFEIVTAPMILSEHQARWPLVQDVLRDKCRGWGLNEYGVHVHVSRTTLTKLHIGKILVFVNSEKNRQRLVRLAGRSDERWSRLIKKKFTDGRRCNAARYEAVNLQNDATVEFRMFQSTTKGERLLMYVEFVAAVVAHLQDASMTDVEDWGLFRSHVDQHQGLYPHLAHYLGVPSRHKPDPGKE